MTERDGVAEGRQYHIACGPGDVGRYVLLPGDPGRVPAIASFLDAAREVARNREFVVCTGELDGEAVSVCSTGIGAPSTAIAVEELAAIGADTLIRVGRSGGLLPDLEVGSIVVATGAIRDEGTSRAYLPIEFPAVPDLTVTNALIAAADMLGLVHRFGIIESKDSFFAEVHTATMPMAEVLEARWRAYRRVGVLCSEMEAAALFTVATVRGVRAGCVVQISDNQFAGHPPGPERPMDDTIRVAITGLRRLIAGDRARMRGITE
ncbi:MAG TPA: nucleoside phosphorylase [Patescibacteria group bacterium]|nr:nucleoside phosphorylase [Patescibacteria group bacterium]